MNQLNGGLTGGVYMATERYPFWAVRVGKLPDLALAWR